MLHGHSGFENLTAAAGADVLNGNALANRLDGGAGGDRLDGRSVIYAQYGDIKDRLGSVALDLANSGASTILVVDDCPDEAHLDILAKRT